MWLQPALHVGEAGPSFRQAEHIAGKHRPEMPSSQQQGIAWASLAGCRAGGRFSGAEQQCGGEGRQCDGRVHNSFITPWQENPTMEQAPWRLPAGQAPAEKQGYQVCQKSGAALVGGAERAAGAQALTWRACAQVLHLTLAQFQALRLHTRDQGRVQGAALAGEAERAARARALARRAGARDGAGGRARTAAGLARAQRVQALREVVCKRLGPLQRVAPCRGRVCTQHAAVLRGTLVLSTVLSQLSPDISQTPQTRTRTLQP